MKIDKAETWTIHESAAPITDRKDDSFIIGNNGKRTCAGGWQFMVTGVEPRKVYRIGFQVQFEHIDHPEECLSGQVIGGEVPPDKNVKNFGCTLPEGVIIQET